MDIVSQITTKTAGEPKRKQFAVEDLDKALEGNVSGKRKQVTLHPADYASVWQPDDPQNDDPTPLEIPDSVFVTIMPGAIVEYFEAEDLSGDRGFRLESFLIENEEGGEETYSGDPFAPIGATESNHPLHHEAGDLFETYANRYKYPNFTGAVENVADLNLASEWAFKQEFERDLWSVKGKEEGEENGRQTVINAVPFRGTVEFEGGNKTYIENKDLGGEDVGAKVTINHRKYQDQDREVDGTVDSVNQSTLTVGGTDYVATQDTDFEGGISSLSDLSSGDRVGINFFVNEDDENEAEVIERGFNDFRNQTTTKVIQSLTVDDGHVLGAETLSLKDRINPAGDEKIDVFEDGGNLVVEHAATGFVDGNGDPIPAPTVSEAENTPGPNPGEGFSVALRTLETDDRGHLKNIKYAPNVESIEGGRGIEVNHLAPGSPRVFEVSAKISDYDTDGNISISDGGSTIDVSLADARTQQARSSDPNDPEDGKAVTWISDGTESGDAGDFLIKVNIGGTIKQGTLFDFSAA